MDKYFVYEEYGEGVTNILMSYFCFFDCLGLKIIDM